jgi:hypothetical protein
LNPPIPLWIPERHQHALAHALIDYGPDYDVIWGCFQDDTEIWWLPNSKVRAVKNITMGRTPTAPNA